mmetsp:Transcript_17243/g.22002  ORF Transcript_17243/g.22002 Transcript_17243/m.22002 type:complete len:692 (+) Transcript_17243:150-2225(+)
MSQVIFIAFVLCFSGHSFLNNVAMAHRTLPDGVTCGNQFNSSSTALVIPNTAISWASYRIMTCDEPNTWYEGSFIEGQVIKFTVGVPRLERFAHVRMNVVITGPNLPLLSTLEKAEIPQAILDEIGGNGAVLFEAPEDQSTCVHLTSQEMQFASEVVGSRCEFHEEFGDSHSWVLLDEKLMLNSTGTFRMVLYNRKQTATKAWFACCDWPEDFTTPYDMPDANCPYCGTKPKENPVWASHFYEQRSMAEYGGFPNNETCLGADITIQEPTEGQCPLVDSGIDKNETENNCVLHCSGGSCHSHNVFGGCVFEIDWMIPEPRLPGSGSSIKNLVLFTGDAIKLKTADQFAHNVYEFLDPEDAEMCNFSNSIERANTEETDIGHLIAFSDAGEYFLACSILCDGLNAPPCHCSIGQKLKVEVKDVSEGKMCHSHNYSMPNEVNPTTCPDNFVVVSSVGDGTYAPPGLCAEFCMPSTSVPPQLTMSSCAGIGYDVFVEQKTISPPNISPSTEGYRRLQRNIDVKLYSNEGTIDCHCHSFENITCNAEGDGLYDEHISEITQFCQGIVNGTEYTCPYNCFQPFEVLHLHYLLCDYRIPHPFFKLIEKTQKCHLAARSYNGSECGSFETELSNQPLNEDSKGLSAGQIAGAVIGSLAILSIIIAIAAYVYKQNIRKSQTEKKQNASTFNSQKKRQAK